MFYPRSVDIIKIVLHLWMKGSPFQHTVAGLLVVFFPQVHSERESNV